MRTSTRVLLGLSLSIIAVASVAWLLRSVEGLHDRLAGVSPELALAAVVLGLAVLGAAGLAGARLLWKLGRADSRPDVRAPEEVVAAARVQLEDADRVIDQVTDPAARDQLRGTLSGLRVRSEAGAFRVVVFGTVSAGKTSLVNALLGREVGRTDAVMGTTRSGQEHTHRIDGLDGTLFVTDTPGMSEAGEPGRLRETEARALATGADLLLFVVDHDLLRSEFDPLAALARLGKRSIVVFNKTDRFPEADRAAILARLRERLKGIVPAEDVVPAAAAPLARVRTLAADGSRGESWQDLPPELGFLRARIAAVLAGEGADLRAGNLLLQAHQLSRDARAQVTRERRARAEAVVDRFQWITAAAVFSNPLPAVDLLASGAVQFQMVSEIAGVYGVELSTAHARTIGHQMVQTLLKLGIVEAASSLVAGAFKSTLVGFAAGGAIQATTMAYLTHIAGHAFADYFERGQSWGDGGMQAALARQFELTSRLDFLQEFAQQALRKVVPGSSRQGAGAVGGER